jgi:hypothetical protein
MWREDLACRVLALVAVALPACGGDAIPARLVGQSEHFRLWIDNDLTLPEGTTADMPLSALESNWTDMRTFFETPDAVIDYYWLAPANIHAVCRDAHADGCQYDHVVVANTPWPDHHELNHAYAALLRPSHLAPFLLEGIASALGCSQQQWPLDGQLDVPWRLAVAADYDGPPSIYTQGARFVHHLVTTEGVAAFMRYYVQAPGVSDPDVFAANFATFWSRSLDDVWAEMLNTPSVRLSSREIWPICPCSLPSMILDGAVHSDLYHNAYWRIPDLGGDTAALTLPSTQNALHDCAAETTSVLGAGDEFTTFLARLTSRHYVGAYPLQGRRGQFLAEACEATEPYDLPGDQPSGALGIIATPQEGVPLTLYVQLRTSVPRRIWSDRSWISVCSSCSFDGPGCGQLTPGTPAVMAGTTYVRIDMTPTDPLALPTTPHALSFGP